MISLTNLCLASQNARLFTNSLSLAWALGTLNTLAAQQSSNVLLCRRQLLLESVCAEQPLPAMAEAPATQSEAAHPKAAHPKAAQPEQAQLNAAKLEATEAEADGYSAEGDDSGTSNLLAKPGPAGEPSHASHLGPTIGYGT